MEDKTNKYPLYTSLSEDKKEQIENLLLEIKKHTPWEWKGSIWKTESSYWSWLRGTLRSIWSRKWVFKNNYLQTHTFLYPVLDENGNQKYYKSGKKQGQSVTRKHFKCEITGETLSVKDGQIDHVIPSGSLRDGLGACLFLFRLLTSPDNMRIISKDAHEVITHMERTGLSWDEAVIEKNVIKKLKQKVEDQKKELIKYGFKNEEISNGKKRKECYLKILGKNK
jgi:hypothetical protein